MYEITMEELRQFSISRLIAKQFALDHYEDLVARKHTYTLYGPHAYFLGASIPCNTVVPQKARKLLHKTRRKDYVIYHLDEQYKVLRTIIILNYTKVDVIYHHFELDGAIYAFSTPGTMQDGEICPCQPRGDMKNVIGDDILFLRFENEKPVSYGNISRNFVFIQFYEYIDAERMFVTTYRYSPYAECSIYGYPIDPTAPIGSLNSSVHQRFYEEIPEDTDFSRWFK